MKTTTLTALAWAALASASPITTNKRQQADSGTGPFAPAGFYTTDALPAHTIFAPTAVPAGARLPVLVWGNGGCSADTTGQAPFLTQIASQGVLVIASGTPGGSGSTTAALMTEAIDFVTATAGGRRRRQLGGRGSGRGRRDCGGEGGGEGDGDDDGGVDGGSSGGGGDVFAQVDASRIVAAGFSCGGLEAYAQIWDDRVSAVGIWNSGLLTNHTAAEHFPKPVFFFLGGPGDIAYENGERDYAAMAPGVPKWKGNVGVGHGGTYHEPNGGLFGVTGSRWVDWLLRGDAEAAAYFTGDGAAADGWEVEHADLDRIQISPIA